MAKTKKKRNKKKTGPSDPRDWFAVHAHFRRSKGPMKEKRRDARKRACRKKVDETDE